MEDLEFIKILILRLFLACLVGVIIGLEREFKGKFAGIRTHTIVALGAALAMTNSIRDRISWRRSYIYKKRLYIRTYHSSRNLDYSNNSHEHRCRNVYNRNMLKHININFTIVFKRRIWDF